MAYASRQSSYLIASVGATIQVVAAWWDVYSHLLFGSVDPWWNPAHLTLYLGFLITILAIHRGLRNHPTQPFASLSPIKFQNVGGLKLAAFGTGVEIVAGVWNEIVHHVFQNEPRIAPAHGLLVLGMLIVAFGMVVGLAIEYGMITHGIVSVSLFRRRLTLLCVVLTFASIWLAAAGALIYLAQVFRTGLPNLLVAVILAFVAPLVLVPAKRVLPRFGVWFSIGIVLNTVSFFFLVIYAGAPFFFPWGLIPLAMLDMLVLGLRRIMPVARAIVISSMLLGLFFWALYYPYTLYLFSWSGSLTLPTLIVFLGGAAGSILGDRVYSRISGVVLGGAA